MSLDLNTLENLLALFRVDTRSWGKGDAKTAEDLLDEIVQGETRMVVDEKGLHRSVSIVKLFIWDRNRPQRGFLVELKQRLPDGRIRRRNQPPSEKIKRGESPREAAIRGLGEELQTAGDGYTLLPSNVALEKRLGSYPGLTCIYTVHIFEVILDLGSPALRKNFATEEEDGTKLFFGWRRIKVGKPNSFPCPKK